MFEPFNGIEKLKAKIRAIDSVKVIQTVEQTRNDSANISRVEQPEGPLFAVYKRNPAGYNKRVCWNLTLEEAEKSCRSLNDKAAKTRRRLMDDRHNQGLEYIPDASDLILYDVVECNSEQENLYWNNRPIMLEI